MAHCLQGKVSIWNLRRKDKERYRDRERKSERGIERGRGRGRGGRKMEIDFLSLARLRLSLRGKITGWGWFEHFKKFIWGGAHSTVLSVHFWAWETIWGARQVLSPLDYRSSPSRVSQYADTRVKANVNEPLVKCTSLLVLNLFHIWLLFGQ